MLDRLEKPAADDTPQIWSIDFSVANYPELALKLATEENLSKLEWLILLKNDSLEGVTSRIEIATKYPTGIALVRDATGTLSSKQPLSPGDPLIESNNMLLRTLSTMRAIDRVLARTGKSELQTDLKQKLIHLIAEVKQFQLNIAQEKIPFNQIESMEARFNLFLKHTLIAAGLAEGLNTQCDFEMMLTHYRNLASALEPAKSMVTIQQYGSVTHTETAHPVTRKTALQKEQLAAITLTPATGKNFHSAQMPAMQIANIHFQELIAKDDRRLPAGSRATIAPTVKNGYVVQDQLYSADSTTAPAECWFTRGGSLAYTGEGETPEQIDAFAEANLQQLQEHIARLRYGKSEYIGTRIHLAVLLTNSRWENQSTIISHTKAAKEHYDPSGEVINYTNIPLNVLGVFAGILEISRLVREQAKHNHSPLPSQLPEFLSLANLSELLKSLSPTHFLHACQSSRLMKAIELIQRAAEDPAVTNYISCASGQDRTGIACEVLIQQWLVAHGIALTDIQQARGLACHNAVVAGLATPGSTGMKPVSQPGDYLPAEMNTRFYRASADRNGDTKHSNPLTRSEEHTSEL